MQKGICRACKYLFFTSMDSWLVGSHATDESGQELDQHLSARGIGVDLTLISAP